MPYITLLLFVILYNSLMILAPCECPIRQCFSHTTGGHGELTVPTFIFWWVAESAMVDTAESTACHTGHRSHDPYPDPSCVCKTLLIFFISFNQSKFTLNAAVY